MRLCSGTDCRLRCLPPALRIELLQECEIERIAKDKTYYSKVECGRFILLAFIIAGKATCRYYGTQSYVTYKQAFYEDECPSDLALSSYTRPAQ